MLEALISLQPLNATGQVAPPGGGSQHCSQAEQHILHDRALQTGAGQREEPRQPTDVSRTPGGEHAVVRHGEPARLRICGNLRRSDCRQGREGRRGVHFPVPPLADHRPQSLQRAFLLSRGHLITAGGELSKVCKLFSRM
ncbi:hypothetical protein NQZ68_015708 [Dissostichus eleginoides]|nr:hypothetical protein NQZ68_015708 [Dissostichus eleginoides]